MAFAVWIGWHAVSAPESHEVSKPSPATPKVMNSARPPKPAPVPAVPAASEKGREVVVSPPSPPITDVPTAALPGGMATAPDSNGSASTGSSANGQNSSRHRPSGIQPHASRETSPPLDIRPAPHARFGRGLTRPVPITPPAAPYNPPPVESLGRIVQPQPRFIPGPDGFYQPRPMFGAPMMMRRPSFGFHGGPMMTGRPSFGFRGGFGGFHGGGGRGHR